MDYIPNTDADREEMLKVVGVKSVADLFVDVPEKLRFPKLDLPPALTEMEMLQELQALGDENDDLNHIACFLGAGAYNHFVPKVVDSLISRGEFYTAYTPYQPEISQGTLQAHFEYQSMITALTGMEVSNVSHYDGGDRGGRGCHHGSAGWPQQAAQSRAQPHAQSTVPRSGPHLHPGHGRHHGW